MLRLADHPIDPVLPPHVREAGTDDRGRHTCPECGGGLYDDHGLHVCRVCEGRFVEITEDTKTVQA